MDDRVQRGRRSAEEDLGVSRAMPLRPRARNAKPLPGEQAAQVPALLRAGQVAAGAQDLRAMLRRDGIRRRRQVRPKRGCRPVGGLRPSILRA